MCLTLRKQPLTLLFPGLGCPDRRWILGRELVPNSLKSSQLGRHTGSGVGHVRIREHRRLAVRLRASLSAASRPLGSLPHEEGKENGV